MAHQAFAREATGLVRAISVPTMFMYQMSGLVPCFMLIWAYTDIAFLYPGANMMLASVITAVVSIPTVGLTLSLMAIAFPRSGGEYNWISRVFHPGLGFASGVQYLMAQPATVGMFAAILSNFVLAAVFGTIGIMTHDSATANLGSTLSQPNVMFAIGTVILVIATLVMIAPLKVFSIYQYVGFIASMIGVALFFGLLAINTTSSFAVGFDKFSTIPYSQVIQAATKSGASIPSGYDMGATLLGLPYLLWWATSYWNIYPAGEAKSPTKSMLLGGLGPMILFWVIMIVGGLLYYNVIPYNFAYALTWFYYNAPAQSPLPAGMYPSPQLLAAFLSDNVLLVGAIAFLFFLGFVYVWPGWWMVFSRDIFAYSFDRVIPTKLSEVSDTTHTPIYAVLLSTGFSLVFMWWSIYGPYFWAVSHYILWCCSTGFIPAMLAGALFPYLKKEWFEGSPKIVRAKIAGVPILTISGLLGTGIMVFQVYQTLKVDMMQPQGQFGIALELATWIVAFGIYYASKYYHKARGIDITRAFEEIPPE